MEQKELRQKMFTLILSYEGLRQSNNHSFGTHVDDINLLIDKILELIGRKATKNKHSD